MSYARPPMGDYKTYGYAGDPGWLSSAFKFIKKKVIPAIFGTVKKEVGTVLLGGAAGAAGAAAMGGREPAATPPGTIGGAVTFPGGVRVAGAYTLPSHEALIGHTPAGYHLRKDKRLPAKWVRNRRMNIANPRALRKAMRRVQGFEKLAKRTISFTRRVKMKK